MALDETVQDVEHKLSGPLAFSKATAESSGKLAVPLESEAQIPHISQMSSRRWVAAERTRKENGGHQAREISQHQ